MGLRRAAAFLALLLFPVAGEAAANPPPAPILGLVNAVIHATNTDDASGLATIFASDAVVVDENPPFVWRGTAAGVAWWREVDRILARHKLVDFKAANVRIGEFVQSPADAYLVQSLTLTGVAAGKPFAESGTLTYTFHKSGSTWLISTLVWTTKP